MTHHKQIKELTTWFLTDVGVLSCIYWPTGKHLALLVDVVSGFMSFSEAPYLAWKCGTHKSDSHVRAL
jgi:hypothetical protein